MLPNMRRPEFPGLRDRLRLAARPSSARIFSAAETEISFTDIMRGSGFAGHLDGLRDKSVLILTQDQLIAALVLAEIDGVVRRLVLCPPDVARDHLPMIIARAEVEAIITDGAAAVNVDIPIVRYELPIKPAGFIADACVPTEWVLMTSATTGTPKMVVHDRASLTAAIKPTLSEESIVWGTFYDIRRYGGLQIFLRATLAHGSLVLSAPDEPTSAFLRRLGVCGVTHISGTPTHWRRVLMSGLGHRIAPKYIRLSGEIADQAILDNLRSSFPSAAIGHAYASTEAGVAFEVNDGLEGFPADLLQQHASSVEMRIEDGSLRIRSPRTAARYLGTNDAPADKDGFVDTGDMLERRGNRYHFVGRRSGIINVGGLKVHPEEVEGVISLHHGVRMALVKARRSPITGALVVADVVLKDGVLAAGGGHHQGDALKDEILHICKDALPPHKVPASIRFVPSLAVAASGKLARTHA
jgi:acyl-coenzyme A synthetase/AMP-(fatty) acid ligase